MTAQLVGCGGEKSNNAGSATTTDPSADRNLDYEAIAQDLCDCMQPMMEIQNQIMALSDAGKTDEIRVLLDSGKLQEATDKGDECVSGMEVKYGALREDEEKRANAAFRKACPEIAKMLSEGGNNDAQKEQ